MVRGGTTIISEDRTLKGINQGRELGRIFHALMLYDLMANSMPQLRGHSMCLSQAWDIGSLPVLGLEAQPFGLLFRPDLSLSPFLSSLYL